MASPRALELIRQKKMIPLPCNRTLQRKFQFLNCQKGFVEPSLSYLRDLVPRMNPGDQIACLQFDETWIKKQAERDQNLDVVIGPYNQANTVIARSLNGNWSFPIYVCFDEAITVTRLFEIIVRLEEIGVLVHATVCDMGPKNRG